MIGLLQSGTGSGIDSSRPSEESGSADSRCAGVVPLRPFSPTPTSASGAPPEGDGTVTWTGGSCTGEEPSPSGIGTLTPAAATGTGSSVPPREANRARIHADASAAAAPLDQM